MTYVALGESVWFGTELVCRAANIKYATAIADALNEWQKL